MKFVKSLSLLTPLLALSFALTTSANAIDIMQDQIDQCVQGTVNYKIADVVEAKKLCTCTIGVRSRMTIGQMWEIESYALSGKDPSTLPYVLTLQNELQQCTNGLKLMPPQVPNAPNPSKQIEPSIESLEE